MLRNGQGASRLEFEDTDLDREKILDIPITQPAPANAEGTVHQEHSEIELRK